MRSCSFSSFESSSGPGSAAETETETNCDFKQEEQEQEHKINKHHQVSEEKEVCTLSHIKDKSPVVPFHEITSQYS